MLVGRAQHSCAFALDGEEFASASQREVHLPALTPTSPPSQVLVTRRMPILRGGPPLFPLLFFLEDHELAAAAPMLGWRTGDRWQAGMGGRRSSAWRCSMPCAVSSAAVHSQRACFELFSLEFDLSNAAWKRILDEYAASDLVRAMKLVSRRAYTRGLGQHHP